MSAEQRATATLNAEGHLTVTAADGTRYVYWAGSCGEEDCDCRDVVLYPIAEQNAPETGLEGVEELRVDTDAGLIMDEEGDPLETDSPAFLAALDDALTGPTLEALVRRWHEDKGEPLAEGRLEEFLGLEDWELDDLVAWEQAFETLRMDEYVIDGTVYLAMELYSANPADPEHEVLVDFAEQLDHEDEDDADEDEDDEIPVGTVILRKGGSVTKDPEEGEEELLEQLWALYQRRHPSLDRLWQRNVEIKEIGQILLSRRKRR